MLYCRVVHCVLIVSLIYLMLIYLFFSYFFFSSRRRHTRSLCDWSSDVCSSDLRFHHGIPLQPLDNKCQSCHQQHSLHEPNVVQNRSCSVCHQEHKGAASMRAVEIGRASCRERV